MLCQARLSQAPLKVYLTNYILPRYRVLVSLLVFVHVLGSHLIKCLLPSCHVPRRRIPSCQSYPIVLCQIVIYQSVVKIGPFQASFSFIFVFSNKHYIFTCLSSRYTVLGFEQQTFRTRVSCHNQLTKAPALDQ